MRRRSQLGRRRRGPRRADSSDFAIETTLILRTVFHQPLRQTEGLVGSLLELMGLDLPVPDHSTLSRRSKTLAVAPQAASGPVHLLVDSTGVKLSGPGEWLVEKHGTQRRRAWRKLHLAVDAKTGTIVASTLTSKEVDDAAELGPLLDQVDEPLAAVIADGAYDQDRVYDGVAEHSPEAWLSCHRARRPCSVHRPKPIQPSAIAISRPLPSRAGWVGKKPRATMRGRGRRVR